MSGSSISIAKTKPFFEKLKSVFIAFVAPHWLPKKFFIFETLDCQGFTDEGSNPSLSAIKNPTDMTSVGFFMWPLLALSTKLISILSPIFKRQNISLAWKNLSGKHPMNFFIGIGTAVGYYC